MGVGGSTTTSTSTSSSGGGACAGGAIACADKSVCGASTECALHDCVSNCCDVQNQPDGMALTMGQTAGDCQDLVCDGKGATRMAAASTDLPPAMDACHVGACNGSQMEQPPVAGPCVLNGAAAVCGDPAGSAAGKCVECNATADCQAGKGCLMNACLTASCTDGILDGDETAKDCGGSCLPCAVGQPCLVQSDCAPGYCKTGVCAPPSCLDALKDGNETDVDCGGPMCPKCAAGKTCLAPGDCQTGVNGQPTCAGTCGFACNAGFGDCDPVVGCETDTTKPAKCGSCNVACSAYCVNGGCNDPVTITAGYSHNCAILKDGSVYCWGFNQLGEVGDGTTGNKITPTKIALPLAATAISAKGVFLGGVTYSAHTCAILLDQSVWCWGGNANGELGQGDTAVYAGPVKVKNLASINQLVVGGAHTCAVNANNDLYCWGRNTNGQIGNALATPVLLPQLILAGVTSKLALGSSHTCIVKTDGNPYCWGGNSTGQLGSGNLTATNAPGGAVAGLTGVVEIAAGSLFTCARTATAVSCWGRNAAGELGLGNMTQQLTPQVVPGLANVTQLGAGVFHTAAVTAGGVYMWGADGHGELGDGLTTSIVPTPELVAGLATFKKVSLGNSITCGLTATFKMSCWGDNSYGSLGDGTTNQSSVPVAVAWP